MHKRIVISIVIALAISIGAPAKAASIVIPGKNIEEVNINRDILKSDDERAVCGYLIDARSSIRLSACMRLNKIGTTYALQKLEDIARTDSSPDVRSEAASALWNIKYRDEIARGSDGSQLLFFVLNNDGDPTKTHLVKGWAIDLLGDKVCLQALPILKSIAVNSQQGPYTDYLMKKAAENIIKIEHTSQRLSAPSASIPAAAETANVQAGTAISANTVAPGKPTAKTSAAGIPDSANNVPLAGPAGLTAAATAENSVVLHWDRASGNPDGFKIECSQSSSGPFREVGTTIGSEAKYFTHLGITGGTKYYYRVRAYEGTAMSNYSDAVFVITPASVDINQPSNLTAVVFASGSTPQVKLSWTDDSNNEDGFYIERKTYKDASFIQIGSALKNAATYVDAMNLQEGMAYAYRVRAYGSGKFSNYSNEIKAFVMVAPSNLAAKAISATKIRLTWSDNSGIETGYKVERCLRENGPYIVIAKLGADTTDYTDTELEPDVIYYYRVCAYNDFASAYSGKTYGSPGTQKAPKAPTTLTISGKTSSVTLSWVDNSINEDGISLERTAGNQITIILLSPNSTTYADSELTPGIYTYRVRAYIGNAYSDYSNSVDYLLERGSPDAPTNLEVATSLTLVTLRWTDNSTYEDGFSVERKEKTGQFVEIVRLFPNTASYTDYNVALDTPYTYRVRAYAGVAYSNYSNSVDAVVRVPGPNTPTDLTITSKKMSSITLSWVDNATNEEGFSLERIAGTNAPIIINLPPNTTTYTDSDFKLGVNYTYKIRAYIETSYSAYSNTVDVILQSELAAPSDLTATALSASRIDLSWNYSSFKITGFEIWRTANVYGSYSLIATVDYSARTFTNTGLSSNFTYYYKIRAFDSSNYSPYSNVVSATTGS